MKLKEKNEAIALRKKGWMLPAISKHLKVAKSTVSVWIRDVELTEKQRKDLFRGRDRSRLYAGIARRNRRIKATEQLFEEGRTEALSRASNSFFVSGIMLYWAEGAKSTEAVKFSNSDPAMIKFMMSWFRKICEVPENRFRIHVHMHNLHSRPDIESYWSKITGVPKSQFYKTYIKKTTLKHRRNRLYEGTCTIAIGNKNLFRKMQGWKAGVLESFSGKA